MADLARHDLVWLSSQGWTRLLRGAPDAQAADCLAHWCAQRLPLVVSRQTPGGSFLALGLAAPQLWERRKFALQVPPACVLYHDRFPKAADIARLMPAARRKVWSELQQALAALGVEARVHGSFGWQYLTGLPYLTPHSDIDLLLRVPDVAGADSVAALLETFNWKGRRLDGELLLRDGCAVAWREWLSWRRGTVHRIMVKRLYGVALESGFEWLSGRSPVAA